MELLIPIHIHKLTPPPPTQPLTRTQSGQQLLQSHSPFQPHANSSTVLYLTAAMTLDHALPFWIAGVRCVMCDVLLMSNTSSFIPLPYDPTIDCYIQIPVLPLTQISDTRYLTRWCFSSCRCHDDMILHYRIIPLFPSPLQRLMILRACNWVYYLRDLITFKTACPKCNGLTIVPSLPPLEVNFHFYFLILTSPH